MSAALVGVAAGALGALLGVGGGVVLVPGLVFVAGLSFGSAVATSLVCIVATSISASAVYLRRRQVALPLVIELQFYAAAGAVLAGLLATYIPAAPLHFAFAGLLAVVAAQIWPRGVSGGRPVRRSAPAAVVSGSFVGAGLVSGLLGVGGGILNVPILHMLVGLPFDRAVASSIFIIGVTAASAGIVYFVRGMVQADVAALAVLGTLLGAQLAALLGRRFDPQWLKAGFALLLLYVAFRMVLRGAAVL